MKERKIEKYLIKSPKQMLMVIAVFTLMIFVGGTTYAFFNYTRTGRANTLNTGRIYFSTEQTNANTITLNNIFPMTKEEALADSSTNGTLVVTFTGDTTYTDGIEYLLSIDNVSRTANIPISLIMDVNVTTTATGASPVSLIENANYYTERNTKTASMYKAEGEDMTINSANHKVITDIENGQYLLAGYIKSGTDVVTGTVTIKAFIDADKILITDTPDDQSNAPEGYTDGTDTTGKTVISTSDWNSLQSTGVSFKIKGEANEGIWVERRGTAFSTIAKQVDRETQIDFGLISSDTNGKGVYILPGTENDVNPIYYYRGAVTNNNVIFGGFCWLIVRTTETGGTKMIYNGVATGTTENPTCENAVGTARQLASTTRFNSNNTSMSDIGYMYNKRYSYTNDEAITGAYFATEAEYDETNKVYNLKAGTTSTTLDATHHYTCNLTNESGTCSSIRYYYYNSGSNCNYITLTDGDFIEDALYKMTGNGSSETKAKNASYVLNQNDSALKTLIENWFKENLTNEVDSTKINFQNYLEDTVFCNDRSYQQVGSNTLNLSGWNPNGGSLGTDMHFNARTRWNNGNWYSTTHIPTFVCVNDVDKFTVSNDNGNGKLKYPVGLLTVDEMVLAGASGNGYTSNTSYYLYMSNNFWSMSPYNFSADNSFEFAVHSNGNIINRNVYGVDGVRPVISLKSGTGFVEGGEGTTAKPYVVKYTS